MPEENEVVDETQSGGETKEPTFMDELNAHMKAEAEAESGRKKRESDELIPDDAEVSDDEEDDAEEDPGEKDDAEQDDDGDDEPAIDDVLLERAVKAGMTLADAKAVADPDALDRIVSRLESAAQSSGDDKPGKAGESGKDGKEGDEKDPLDELELDPEDYDEGLVAAVKTLKDTMLQQKAVIAELKQELATRVEATKSSWIDGEVAKLGDDWKETFGEGNAADLPAGAEKAARAKLERHIQFAQEDAKADGKKLTNAQAFKNALSTAFGDKQTELKGKTTREAASKRSARSLNRPRGLDGKFHRNEDAGDATMTDEERERQTFEEIGPFFEKNA